MRPHCADPPFELLRGLEDLPDLASLLVDTLSNARAPITCTSGETDAGAVEHDPNLAEIVMPFASALQSNDN